MQKRKTTNYSVKDIYNTQVRNVIKYEVTEKAIFIVVHNLDREVIYISIGNNRG